MNSGKVPRSQEEGASGPYNESIIIRLEPLATARRPGSLAPQFSRADQANRLVPGQAMPWWLPRWKTAFCPCKNQFPREHLSAATMLDGMPGKWMVRAIPIVTAPYLTESSRVIATGSYTYVDTFTTRWDYRLTDGWSGGWACAMVLSLVSFLQSL